MSTRSLPRWVSLASAPWRSVLLFGLSLAGCSEESLDPAGTSDETAGETSGRPTGETPPPSPGSTSDTEGEGTTAPEACQVPRVENEAEAEPFEQLSAVVVDQAGDPVADTIVQACGLNVCLQGNTTAQGRAVINGEDEIEKLAFKYGDGLHHAQVALLLSGASTYDLGEQRTVSFPAADPDNRFEGGSTLTSSDVELSLADDTVTTIDVLSYADESEHLFVAQAFEQDGFPEAAEDEGFDSLWALGPAKTEFCPPAQLSLPNVTEVEPGTAVDLLLLVTDVSGRYGLYGEWTVVADATVSDDGDHIVTDAGRGIPELGLIGVRPQK